MTEHRIGTQGERRAERDALLTEEKELTRRSDDLARKRRELPWVPVEKNYTGNRPPKRPRRSPGRRGWRAHLALLPTEVPEPLIAAR